MPSLLKGVSVMLSGIFSTHLNPARKAGRAGHTKLKCLSATGLPLWSFRVTLSNSPSWPKIWPEDLLSKKYFQAACFSRPASLSLCAHRKKQAALMPAHCTVPLQPTFLSLTLSVFLSWVKNILLTFFVRLLHAVWFPTLLFYFPHRKKIKFTEHRKVIICHLANCRVWILASHPITCQEKSAREQRSQSVDEAFSNSLSNEGFMLILLLHIIFAVQKALVSC